MFLDVFFEKAAEQHADAIAIEQGKILYTSTGRLTERRINGLTFFKLRESFPKTK